MLVFEQIAGSSGVSLGSLGVKMAGLVWLARDAINLQAVGGLFSRGYMAWHDAWEGKSMTGLEEPILV